MSITFNYTIYIKNETFEETNQGNEFFIREEFNPYDKKRCLDYCDNHTYSKDLKPLIDEFTEKSTNTDESEEISYVLLDAICLISSFTGKTKKYRNYKFRKYEIDFFEYYKLVIQNLKFDYSILTNCHNIISNIEADNNLKEIAFSYLGDLNNNYNFNLKMNDTLDNQILFTLKQLNQFYDHKINISVTENEVSIIDNFIDNIKKMDLSSIFFYKRKDNFNCFAIAFKKDFYYAISGYDYNTSDARFEKISDLLKPNKSTYCITNERMRSYGYKVQGKEEFVQYDNYILHDIGNDPKIQNIKKQFSCCERKILSQIYPETDKNRYKLKFICKYKPCIDCSLALMDASNEYYHGIDFKFYYVNSVEFSKHCIYTKNYIQNNANNNSIKISFKDL